MHNAIIPYIGGKRRLAKHLLPLINGHDCYVEPFAGGASIFFMKEPSRVEVINDLNSEVVNLYRCVKHHLDELVRQFRWALVSREEYLTAQRVDPATLTDIQRASRYYYLQKMAFGGKVTGQTFGTASTTPPKMNILRIEEDLSQAHIRLASAYIENMDWQKLIQKYDRPEAMFFLDPPYWQTEGYANEFPFMNYINMAGLARSIKGKMIITHCECPEIRETFDGLNIKDTPITYTVGGAGKQRKTSELIITNF